MIWESYWVNFLFVYLIFLFYFHVAVFHNPPKLGKFVSLTGLSFEQELFLLPVFGIVSVSVLISSPENLICSLSPRNSSVLLIH